MHAHAGNLSKDGLGLDPEVYQELANTVSHVWHIAGVTSYNSSYDRLEPDNVQATINMMRFCAVGSGHTVYCCSSTTAAITTNMTGQGGLVLEEIRKFNRRPRFVAAGTCRASSLAYAETKWTAERLVTDAALECGLPACIFVLPLIGGHSVTGSSALRNDVLPDFLHDSFLGKMLPNIASGQIFNITPVDMAAFVMVCTAMAKTTEAIHGTPQLLHVINHRYDLTVNGCADALAISGFARPTPVPTNQWRAAIKKLGEQSSTLHYFNYYSDEAVGLDSFGESSKSSPVFELFFTLRSAPRRALDATQLCEVVLSWMVDTGMLASPLSPSHHDNPSWIPRADVPWLKVLGKLSDGNNGGDGDPAGDNNNNANISYAGKKK